VTSSFRFLRSLAAILLLGFFVFPGAAQDPQKPLRPSNVVKSQVYVSLKPVPRGKVFEIAVVLEIHHGYHIQANKVLEEYLIPATVTAELPAGLRLVSTTYPKSLLKKFTFSEKPMAVYEGKITVRIKLEAQPSAALGAVKIPLALRFQACNDELCLPPAKLESVAEFEIAKSGTPTKAPHPEIFSQK
jgi:hypothetical protein